MKYLNLASGAAHFKSPEAALQKTVQALENNETFYGETEGLPALRSGIVQRYAEDFEVQVPVENILVTSGTKQALFNLFSVLLQPGDEVILPHPSWFGFDELFELLQLKPIWLETSVSENFTIDPDKLASLITPKTRLFIYSNPGNPTGRVYTKTDISQWLKVLENYPEIKILSDEIYDLILFDKKEITSLLQFPDPHKKHLIINGFSKNFGMSGWRVGYMVAPAEIIQKSAHFQHATISGVNPFIQEGALAAFQTRTNFLPERIKELQKNRDLLCNWLRKHRLSFYQPDGAYYVFPDLSPLLQSAKAKSENLTAQSLFNYLKENLKVELVSGERFSCRGFARITFAVPEEDLKETLLRLETLLT